MELADLIVVNKADGDLADAARKTQFEYQSALKLIHPKSFDWMPRVTPPRHPTTHDTHDTQHIMCAQSSPAIFHCAPQVMACSAATGKGVDDVIATFEEYRKTMMVRAGEALWVWVSAC
jgi:putative protein kinase ArgK-like GTPase of G3E family